MATTKNYLLDVQTKNYLLDAMDNGSNTHRLFHRLQEACTTHFNTQVSNPQEECRQRWTTVSNINQWHHDWKAFLVSFGFGRRNEDGTVHVPDEQKSFILNLDESALLMDGSTQKKGRHPTVTFYEGLLPVYGLQTSKTSQSTTLITGSTAAGEVLPSHFQFSMTAKSEQHERVCLETVKFMKNVRRKFGHDDVKTSHALLD